MLATASGLRGRLRQYSAPPNPHPVSSIATVGLGSAVPAWGSLTCVCPTCPLTSISVDMAEGMRLGKRLERVELG